MNDKSGIREPTAHEYVVKNRLQQDDQAIHGWYRFVLGYPPHLVREYLKSLELDPEKDWVLDPFCGTATTPVEARLHGYSTLSADANPISVLAARVKLNWELDQKITRAKVDDVVNIAISCIMKQGIPPVPERDYQLSFLSPQVSKLSPKNNGLIAGFDPDKLLSSQSVELIPTGFISPKPLLRVLALRYAIEKVVLSQDVADFLRLALAYVIVKYAGNVGFGPEVYRLPPKEDADVIDAFTETAVRMLSELQTVLDKTPQPFPPAYIFQEDARDLKSLDSYPLAGAVITSPPYPNEKDYTRSTRLESVLLGLLENKSELRALKNSLLRSNTRNVFVNDDDDAYVKDIPSVVKVAEEIETKRLALGKTSGFERLYHRVTRLYFGGMYRHFLSLYNKLRSGATCAYVVGDQMSYFRVHIHTAELLADVAIRAGYQVQGIDLWRTRRSTATGVDLEENVLIFKHP